MCIYAQRDIKREPSLLEIIPGCDPPLGGGILSPPPPSPPKIYRQSVIYYSPLSRSKIGFLGAGEVMAEAEVDEFPIP